MLSQILGTTMSSTVYPLLVFIIATYCSIYYGKEIRGLMLGTRPAKQRQSDSAAKKDEHTIIKNANSPEAIEELLSGDDFVGVNKISISGSQFSGRKQRRIVWPCFARKLQHIHRFRQHRFGLL